MPAHPDGLAEVAVLVDDIGDLQPPPIGGGIELEVHGPPLLRQLLGAVTPHLAVSRACPLLLSRGGPLQPLLAPKAEHSLVVYRKSSPSQQAVGHPPDAMYVVSGDLAETPPQLPVLMETTWVRWHCVLRSSPITGLPLLWDAT